MTVLGILLIGISAALHAGWNLICKARHPSGAFFLIATAASLIVQSPGLFWYGHAIPHIPGTVWLLLFATGFVQAVYYVAIGKAYQTIEVSVAYPIARALPLILIPIVTTVLAIGRPLKWMAVAGMTVVAVGCVLLPMQPNRPPNIGALFRNGFGYVLLAALGITSYTIIDSVAMRALHDSGCIGGMVLTPLLYIFMENLFIAPWLLAWVLMSQAEHTSARSLFHTALQYPVISGCTCTIAYALVLAAMLLASNVSYVMAFRQLSIPVGAVLGILVLRERVSGPKIAGVLLIVAGLMVVALK